MRIFFLLLLFFKAVSAEEIDLSIYEKSLYSPHGEDGILAKIFQLIKPDSKFFIEFGAQDGVSNCITYFLKLQGWKSVSFDRKFENQKTSLYKEFVTGENINSLLRKYAVPYQFDLLSIGLGYNDFYIWKKLSADYQPSVVVIRYNAIHQPNEDKVVKYRPFYCGDKSNYFGASILALYRLGLSKGYTLVYAEASGERLFFIRNDTIDEKQLSFKNTDCLEKLYRSAADYKYTVDTHDQPYVSSLQ